MNFAIILSGGVGSRMNLDIPKQYVLVNNQPIINYCLKTFLENKDTDVIIIGVADEWKAFVEENVRKLKSQKPVYYAKSGETRQCSIFNALKTALNYGCTADDVIIIHDAARPLVSQELINACFDGCEDYEAVMPVIPVKDTIYLSEDGKNIQSLLNRNHLWCGQTPEAFRFGKYFQVHNAMSKDELLKISGSTEMAFKSGLNCHMIKGDPLNFKITTLEDLSNFKAIING